MSVYYCFIAAERMVETWSENVPIGVPFGQVIDKMYVKAGNICKQGDGLFEFKTDRLGSEKDQAEAAELSKLIYPKN